VLTKRKINSTDSYSVYKTAFKIVSLQLDLHYNAKRKLQVVFIEIGTLIIQLELVIIINMVNIWLSITMQMENNRKRNSTRRQQNHGVYVT